MREDAQHQSKVDAATLTPAVLSTVQTVAKEMRPGLGPGTVKLGSSLDRDLGFDSLGRAELVARIEQTFNVVLPEQVFAYAETPLDLVDAVAAALTRDSGRPRPVAAPGALVMPTEAVPRDALTLTQVLSWHEARHPDRPHVRLYEDAGEGEVLTYGELATGARRIAAGLQGRGLTGGDVVGIVLPTGCSYFKTFFGVLMAGGVPAPAYPPARLSRIEEHLRRLLGILASCQARALIIAPEFLHAARLLRAQLPTLTTVATPEELAASDAAELLASAVQPTDLALLQYTSGSTGSPKGVMLSHDNLLANIRAMATAIKAGPEDVFVSWLPLYHDLGLIGAWLGSLYMATSLIIMSPLQFLARPARWLQAIHRYRGTLSGSPNFGYELCIRRIRDEEMKGVDLASWRYAFNGAEPVIPATLERFCDRFGRSGFRRETLAPVYGLAENSVGLAFSPPGRGPVIDIVARDSLETLGRAEPAEPSDTRTVRIAACGVPLTGHQVRIVDPSGRELPDRQEGRVQFRGPSATQGYYRNHAASEKLFDGEWLDSGDRGYVASGDVYITSRDKDLIIRAGRNIHPSDIEGAVGDIDGVLAGHVAAFGSADLASGTERLVILAECRRREPEALERLRTEINAVVADHLGEPADDVVVAPPNTIPRTSSGKIRRTASREIYQSGRIGEGRPRVWLQILRLYGAAMVPSFRRFLALINAGAFATRAWLVAGFMAPVLWVAAMVVPGLDLRWRVLRFGIRLFARLAGVPLTVSGLEHLPPIGQAFIAAANHCSYLDGFALAAALPRLGRFVGKAELTSSPFTNLPLRRIGTFFVDRFDSAKGLEDYQAVCEAARRGESPMFFPEGTFRRMPGLLPFHMGAFQAAAEAGLPVVPIAIRGTRSVLRAGAWFPRRGLISVTVCPPVHPAASGGVWERAIGLRDAVRAEILRHCGEPDLKLERVDE